MIHIKKMMYVYAVVLAVLTYISSAFAAFEYRGLGWPAATANIRAIGQHPEHIVLNPALMDSIHGSEIVFTYGTPYHSLDLQGGSLSILRAIGQKPIIVNLRYFGDELYSEKKATLGTAWSIHDGLRAGLSLGYYSLSFSGFRFRRSLTLSACTSVEISPRFHLGSVIENAIQWNRDLEIPQRFEIATQYETGIARLIVGVEKESIHPLDVCLALLLSPQSFWQIGLGYRDLSGLVTMGGRITSERWALFYVCTIHPDLPTSSGFGLEIKWP